MHCGKGEKRMRKALNLIFNLLLAVLAGAAIFFLILQIRGIQPYAVISGSMEPKIPVGSVCFIDTKIPYEEIKKEDIIAFSKNQVMVTHRVIKTTEKGFETKGDANSVSDGITTTSDNYIGKNIGSIPWLGYAMMFLGTKRGNILILTGILVLILLAAMIDMEKEKQDTQEDLL